MLISTGKADSPTQVGVYAIQTRQRYARMKGEDYDIPDVPYTMYYSGSYAIHGATGTIALVLRSVTAVLTLPSIMRVGYSTGPALALQSLSIANSKAAKLISKSVKQRLKDYCMLFMVIERFRDNDMLPIDKRIQDEGRMFPEGLQYIDSWVEPNFSKCFQLLECDDLRLLQEWILKWRGSGVNFEIVPVVNSKQTQEVVAPLLNRLI